VYNICLIQIQYYVHGKIEPSDLESLYNDTGRVGQLTLGAEPDSSGSRLGIQVLARIAQLQDPNKPLFPLLHRLRIVAPSPSLHFLDLLLSSALTTLELTAIPVDDFCYPSVLSFLECATDQAPNLSTLILGPGSISDQVLDISLRHKNLHRLELIEVGISITNQLLQNIGSLQFLETFVLRNNNTSTYTCSPATPASAENPIIESALFPALQTFEVDGTFNLIEDLVTKVSSSKLRILSIDITKYLERVPPIPIDMGITPQDDDSFGNPFAGRTKKVKTVSTSSRLFQRPPLPLPPPHPQLSTANIMTLLRSSIQKWPNTLVSVRFKNDSAISFWLPSDVFEELLLRPDMKHLELTGMGIDSMDATLHRLKEVGHSKLEVLHLPVHSTAPSISFARLREIAESCSNLKSLRCRLCIRDPQNIMASSPLSHQLEVLSVSNEGKLEQHQILGIARYLDSIFPRLKSIKPHDGNYTEQWRFIYDSVKSYQAVRMDEHQRLGLKLEGEGSKVRCGVDQ